MRILRNGSACALLLAAHVPTFAQAQPQPQLQPQHQPQFHLEPIQQVEIKGAFDAHAQSAAAQVVVGRDELLRHGDLALSDVLKRQPGITIDATPGKPAAIRMRGMGAGYVAILLNGLPAPAGFSLESMGVDAIERVEILRAATAETGGQAVAGTINVILRRPKPGRKGAPNEIKAGATLVDGYLAPQLALQHDGRQGTLAYTLSATLKRIENPVSAASTEDADNPRLLRRTAVFDHQVEDVLELSPRLSWQPNARDTLVSHGYLRRRHIDNAKREREAVDVGSPTAFPHADSGYAARATHAYADVAWTRRFEDGARLNTRLSGFHSRRDAHFTYLGMDPLDQLRETHRVASGPLEREATFSGSWRRTVWDGHLLAAGWEIGRKTRREYRHERQADANDRLLLASDEAYRAEVVRRALFVQDEWDIDASWSAYIGLRREDLRTTGAGNAHAPVDVEAGAWSPILQLLFKPQQGRADTDAPRDAWRFAVTRTYKAPNIVQLMPRRYTVDNNNSVTNPDQQGNPGLRPELALGVDLGWERRHGGHGTTGLGVFHKRIRDITLDRVEARDGVWVAMPDNRGRATVSGIEFEASRTHGPLTARLNLARNWSRVDSLPAPDNRIADQPAFTGKLGLDYASARLDLGGSYDVRGRIAYRASPQLSYADAAKRQLDLYAVWKRDAASRLRLSVSDLLHRDYREQAAWRSVSGGDTSLLHTTRYRPRTSWRLVWEQSL